MVGNPRFEQEDLVREQSVIIEEMKMIEDIRKNCSMSL